MCIEKGGVYAYCAPGSTAERPGIVYGGSLSGSTWLPNHSLVHRQGCFHTTTICCKSTGNLRDPSMCLLPMVKQHITFLAARPQVWGEDTQQMKCAMCTHLRNPNPPSHQRHNHTASSVTYKMQNTQFPFTQQKDTRSASTINRKKMVDYVLHLTINNKWKQAFNTLCTRVINLTQSVYTNSTFFCHRQDGCWELED